MSHLITARRPNAILIECHDLGDWVGCYDRPYVHTPTLDMLATQGVLFSRFFGAAPICMPSRSSIQTGLMPHQVGVLGQEPIQDGHRCLAERFHSASYETVLSGSAQLLNPPERLGFERQLTANGTGPDREAATFLRTRREPAQRPFFLHVSFDRVHRPFGTDHDPHVAEAVDVPPYLPDLPVVRADLATLTRQVEFLDAQVGHLLKALDESGQSGHTLVVFTTDHGMALARAKHTVHDSGLRCALIMRMPGLMPAGLRSDQLLSNIDLMPTLLDLCGIEAAADVLGRSFAPVCRDTSTTGRSEVYSEHTWGRRSGQWYYTPQRSVRTERYRYVRTWSDGPLYIDNGWLTRFRGDLEIVEPYFASAMPAESLFDLSNDPFELTNLIGSPNHQDIHQELAGKLSTFLDTTADPILAGFVPNHGGYPDSPQWQQSADGTFHINRSEPLESKEGGFDGADLLPSVGWRRRTPMRPVDSRKLVR